MSETIGFRKDFQTSLTGRDVKVLIRDGGDFFQYISDMLTLDQQQKIETYLRANKPLAEVIEKW